MNGWCVWLGESRNESITTLNDSYFSPLFSTHHDMHDSLFNTKMGAEGAKAVVEGLKHNRTLEELS